MTKLATRPLCNDSAVSRRSGIVSFGLARTRLMKTFIITTAVLGFCIGAASAVGVAGADHNWTVHVGDSYYGLSGYPATTLPGLWMPDESRLHLGTRAFSLPIPFHCVTGIGF